MAKRRRLVRGKRAWSPAACRTLGVAIECVQACRHWIDWDAEWEAMGAKKPSAEYVEGYTDALKMAVLAIDLKRGFAPVRPRQRGKE